MQGTITVGIILNHHVLLCCTFFFFPWLVRPQWASNSDTSHPVRLLWTSDRSVADLYLTTHNIHKKQIFMPPGDSSPQFQLTSGRRPTPSTARRLGSALCRRYMITFCNHRNLTDVLSGNQLNTASELKM
jgi:hypothetical protein